MSTPDETEASAVWPGALPAAAATGLARPRIGIAGISIESSTFSPHLSGDEAFTQRRGETLMGYYGFLDDGEEMREAADWVPLLQCRSLPGGAVPMDTYQRFKSEILEGIRTSGPFDGFYFDIHGAMSVVGMDDAEGDLAAAVRAELGHDTLISSSMDLHGNVSRELLDAVDLITCYRMAPHEDAWNTKARAVHHLLSRLRCAGGADPVVRRPYKAWVQVPVLLPGEKTSTRIEPARSIYQRVPVVEAAAGVLDASIWVGYAWADEPRCQAAVAVTGDDPHAIAAGARVLAAAYWDARDRFAFVADALDLDACLDAALAADAPRPYVISDSGDNPTAGGAGDVSWTLGELLKRRELADGTVSLIHASIFDAPAVAAAMAAGVGATVTLQVGANVDAGPAGPVTISGTIFSITAGDAEAGTQVVIASGGVHAIITERRKPFHHLEDFTRLGLDPHGTDIVVVKIGYLEPELYELAAGWKLGLTPGGVDQDLIRLGHERLAPGVFPFTDEPAAGDLDILVSRREGQRIVEVHGA